MYLPQGWEGRVTTRALHSDDANPVIAMFPDLHDVCVSKLAAHRHDADGRRFDLEYVRALLNAGHVEETLLLERADALVGNVPREIRARTVQLVESLRG